VDVFASVDGRDLGGVADDTADLLKPFQKQLPRGTQMHVRGQIETMASSYSGLEIGLFMSIVLVYLLIVVNFQSWLDPFIIMTALAMIIGMVPMALGIGEGGEQNAPLGRAVIGGLAVATVATLFFVPVVFSIFHGWRMKRASVRRNA